MILFASIFVSTLIACLFFYFSIVGLLGGDVSIGDLITKINRFIPILTGVVIVISIVLTAAAYALIRKRIFNPIRAIAEQSNLLIRGETDIQIEEKYLHMDDEIGLLSRSFAGIAGNLKIKSEAAERIADGDFSIEIEPKSNKDKLGSSMIAIINTLRSLVTEAEDLTAAAVEGDFEKRGDADKFHGGYSKIIEGFNSTLNAIADPLNIASCYIQAMANGEEPKEPGELKGTCGVLIQNLVYMRNGMDILHQETMELTNAFSRGEISFRVDAGKLKGSYAQILHGINESLDLLTSPLHITAEYLEQIGRGEVPEKITEEYKGDFEQIKNNINACIDGLGAVIESNRILYMVSYEKEDLTLSRRGNLSGNF